MDELCQREIDNEIELELKLHEYCEIVFSASSVSTIVGCFDEEEQRDLMVELYDQYHNELTTDSDRGEIYMMMLSILEANSQ